VANAYKALTTGQAASQEEMRTLFSREQLVGQLFTNLVTQPYAHPHAHSLLLKFFADQARGEALQVAAD
jgi:hypothetical protein